MPVNVLMMYSIRISLQITNAADDEKLREVLVSDDVLGPIYMRPGRCQTGMKIEIVSMFT